MNAVARSGEATSRRADSTAAVRSGSPGRNSPSPVRTVRSCESRSRFESTGVEGSLCLPRARQGAESCLTPRRGVMAVAAAEYQEQTDEQKAIVEMVRDFVDKEIIPKAEEYDAEDKFPEPIVEQMKELGLFGVTIPEEFGGM